REGHAPRRVRVDLVGDLDGADPPHGLLERRGGLLALVLDRVEPTRLPIRRRDRHGRRRVVDRVALLGLLDRLPLLAHPVLRGEAARHLVGRGDRATPRLLVLLAGTLVPLCALAVELLLALACALGLAPLLRVLLLSRDPVDRRLLALGRLAHERVGRDVGQYVLVLVGARLAHAVRLAPVARPACADVGVGQ